MTRRRSLILSIVTAGCWIILLAIVLSSVFAASTLTKQTRDKDRLPCSPRAARRVVSSEGDARKIVSENLQVYLSQSGASVDREAFSARRLIEAALSASRRPSINEDV